MRKFSWYVVDVIAALVGCQLVARTENALKRLAWKITRRVQGKWQTQDGPFRWRVQRAIANGDQCVSRCTRSAVRTAVNADGRSLESSLVRVPLDPEAELWALLEAFVAGVVVRGARGGEVTVETVSWALVRLSFRDREEHFRWLSFATRLSEQMAVEWRFRNYEEREQQRPWPRLAVGLHVENSIREAERLSRDAYLKPPDGTTPQKRLQLIVEALDRYVAEITGS